MELAFETRPLREICESEEKAKSELGAQVAAELKRRLADLRAVTSIEDLPAAKPRKIANACIIELKEKWQLVVVPNHASNPVLASGAIKWREVERIKIVRIEKRA